MDAIDIFKQVEQLGKDADKAQERFEATTRKLFQTATGREWMRLAMHRFNFMGSVFDPDAGMNPTLAAYRDGARAVLSEILNAMPSRPTPTSDDDE